MEGEAHTGGDEGPGRDGHLHRQRVLQRGEAQGVGVVLDEGRGHLAETAPGLAQHPGQHRRHLVVRRRRDKEGLPVTTPQRVRHQHMKVWRQQQ